MNNNVMGYDEVRVSSGSKAISLLTVCLALSLSACLSSRGVDQQNNAAVTQRNQYTDICDKQTICIYETIDPSITARYYNAGPIEVITYMRQNGDRSIIIRHSYTFPQEDSIVHRYNVTFYPEMVDTLTSVPEGKVVGFVSKEYPLLKGRDIQRVCISPKNGDEIYTIDITLGDKTLMK